MRRKEIAEIRKQFSLEKCNITRIDTTLITQGEITKCHGAFCSRSETAA